MTQNFVSEQEKVLKAAGWHQYYNEAYWCHPKTIVDSSVQDYTNYGMSIYKAYEFEINNGQPFSSLLGGLTFKTDDKLKMEKDDDILVDIDWLKGLEREGGDMSFLAVRLVDRNFHLIIQKYDPNPIFGGLYDYVAPNPATRGDVRMFATALGVVLKEGVK